MPRPMSGRFLRDVRVARLHVAVNLRRLRARQKISQEALAQEADVDRSYVSAIERAEHGVSLDNLARLCAALGVELRTLVAPPPGEWGEYEIPRRSRPGRPPRSEEPRLTKRGKARKKPRRKASPRQHSRRRR